MSHQTGGRTRRRQLIQRLSRAIGAIDRGRGSRARRRCPHATTDDKARGCRGTARSSHRRSHHRGTTQQRRCSGARRGHRRRTADRRCRRAAARWDPWSVAASANADHARLQPARLHRGISANGRRSASSSDHRRVTGQRRRTCSVGARRPRRRRQRCRCAHTAGPTGGSRAAAAAVIGRRGDALTGLRRSGYGLEYCYAAVTEGGRGAGAGGRLLRRCRRDLRVRLRGCGTNGRSRCGRVVERWFPGKPVLRTRRWLTRLGFSGWPCCAHRRRGRCRRRNVPQVGEERLRWQRRA